MIEFQIDSIRMHASNQGVQLANLDVSEEKYNKNYKIITYLNDTSGRKENLKFIGINNTTPKKICCSFQFNK